jgi:hypothetical protein
MAKNIFLFIAIFVCSTTLKVQAQTHSDSLASGKLMQFARNIHVFNRLVPQEKVYLHFDNTGYVLGDTVWFKAYVVNASNFLPDTLSGVLYVELLNEKGKLLETKKLKIENGQCHGEFYLNGINVEYFAGFFEIRAYTKFMLNFGEETVFSRVFPVFNEWKEDGQYTKKEIKADLSLNETLTIPLPNLRPKEKKKDKINIDFYPEGGNLITGLTSTVAFKITDDKGRPLNATGELIDSQGEMLTVFSTEHAGMGYFSCTPDGKNKRVKITCNRKDYFFDLPKSKASGYVLQTRHLSQNALIVLVEKSPQTAHSPLALSILCRGEVLFFQEIASVEEPYELKIPYELLSTGVHQISLFDDKGEIFAERLAFILPSEEEQLRLEAVPEKATYLPLELIQIDFSITGNLPDKNAVFSLSVRNGETVTTMNVENIYTNLLLSSDLKGFIENPEDYFRSENPNHKIHKLDLLMMVQGWKRYEWQTMAGIKSFNPLFNREKQLSIKGRVASSDGRNIELLASLVNEKSDQRMDGVTKTDNKGEFYIFPEDFYGTWTLNLRSKGLSNANRKIRLDRAFSPKPKNYAYYETVWKNSDGSEQRSETAEDDAIIQEISSDNDSIAWAFRIRDIEVNAKRPKKRKEFIHQVGREIDLAIDRGEKIPYSIHDYLSERDELYSFGKAHKAVIINGTLIEDEEIFSNPFTEEIRRELLDDEKDEDEEAKEKDRFRKTVSPFVSGRDCDGRDIYENELSFYYGKPHIAKFSHLYEGKLEAFDRTTYRTGRRTYDIRVKELTAKRVIQDVQKIVITGEIQQDCKYEAFTPIYIYPYKDYGMRDIPGVRNTAFDGFSVPKDFFRHQDSNEIYRPDDYKLHRTLYWNPYVKTDKQGKASIRFYNDSFCRKINIKAEGITKNGVPIVAQ